MFEKKLKEQTGSRDTVVHVPYQTHESKQNRKLP